MNIALFVLYAHIYNLFYMLLLPFKGDMYILLHNMQLLKVIFFGTIINNLNILFYASEYTVFYHKYVLILDEKMIKIRIILCTLHICNYVKIYTAKN